MSRTWMACAVTLLSLSAASAGEPNLDELVRAADVTLQDIMANPRTAIPMDVLNEAQEIVITPARDKAYVIAQGRSDYDVLLTRSADGTWNAPQFLKVVAGTLGAQAARTTAGSVKVSKNPTHFNAVAKQSSTPIAPGFHFRREPKAKGKKTKDVQVYGKSEGLLDGVLVVGRYTKVDSRLADSYYNPSGSTPQAASTLLTNLNRYSGPAQVPATTTSVKPAPR